MPLEFAARGTVSHRTALNCAFAYSSGHRAGNPEAQGRHLVDMQADGGLLDAPGEADHFVQLWGTDDSDLIRNLSRYVLSGLERGDAILIVAAADHQAALLASLEDAGAAAPNAIRAGGLTMVDAHSLMSCFMRDMPDRELFRNKVRPLVEGLRARAASGRLRAYGEMVAILWEAGRFMAAIQLEDLWNELISEVPFSLFCAYPIDVSGGSFHLCDFDAVSVTHTHLLPTARPQWSHVVHQAIEDVLGADAASHSRDLSAEASIAWVRRTFNTRITEVLDRMNVLSTQAAAGQAAG